jgi:hypothetical protein
MGQGKSTCTAPPRPAHEPAEVVRPVALLQQRTHLHLGVAVHKLVPARAVAVQVAFEKQTLKPGNHFTGSRVETRLSSYGSAVQVEFESKRLKLGFHLIGSTVETRRLSSYGSTEFSTCTAPTAFITRTATMM